MEDHGGQEDGPGDPEPRAVQELPQEDGIAVHGLGAQVDQQVADHVAQDETEEDGAGHGHDDLAADR